MTISRAFVMAAVSLLALTLGLSGCTTDKKDAQEVDQTITSQTTDRAASEDSDTDPAPVHDLKLEIISPVEETFSPRQARMYEALASGNAIHATTVRCHWDFFLNENNEEKLYQTMDTPGVLSGESKKMCGFTSTFIDRVGTLRTVLTMTVYNAINDNLETVTAERTYTVL